MNGKPAPRGEQSKFFFSKLIISWSLCPRGKVREHLKDRCKKSDSLLKQLNFF